MEDFWAKNVVGVYRFGIIVLDGTVVEMGGKENGGCMDPGWAGTYSSLVARFSEYIQFVYGAQLFHIGAHYDREGLATLGGNTDKERGASIRNMFMGDCRYCGSELRFDFWGVPVDEQGSLVMT